MRILRCDGKHFIKIFLVYLLKINGSSEDVQTLDLRPDSSRFSVFSIAFSKCGKQIIGGGSDGCVYVYDLVVNERLSKAPAEENTEDNDVNTVGFTDDTSNIMYSGFDDGVIKIWDRRCFDSQNSGQNAVGLLVGHLDGVTYIDSKNDGRYLISNSKDQSIKLWDLRVLSNDDAYKRTRRYKSNINDKWDYRFDEVPKNFYSGSESLPDDVSIMTYRGHQVTKTLVRAKLSPLETTGQRFIYTGCSTGRILFYDVLTGNIVHTIDGHTDVIRDIDWHPNRNEILSCSFDFRLNLNSYKEQYRTNEQPVSINDTNATRRSRRIAAKHSNTN